MARRSYKDSSRKRQKKKTTQRVGKLPTSTRALCVSFLILGALGFALAALFVPDWVDWGTAGTTVTLWSLCTETIFNFKTCIELRNDNRYQSLANAGVVSLAMIIIALLIGACTLGVSLLFALGKPIGLFCFDRRRNAALTFFGSLAITVIMSGCWVAYSAIYFSTSDYKNSSPKQGAGVSFYLSFISSIVGALATAGAGINWFIDWRNFEDRVFKKSAITAVLMITLMFFALLSFGTRAWVTSSDHGQFLTDGATANITGRLEVGLFEMCLWNGPTYTCSFLRNSAAKEVRESTLMVNMDSLMQAGTTSAAFLVVGMAFAIPSIALSTIHALREDMGFLCFARHRNGYFAFAFNCATTVALTLSWILYSSIGYGDSTFKENGRLKPGYSFGLTIVASVIGAVASITGCWARRNPDWYGSQYEEEAATAPQSKDPVSSASSASVHMSDDAISDDLDSDGTVASSKKGSAKKGSAKKGSAKKGSAKKGSAKKGSAKKGAAKKGAAKKGAAKKGSKKKANKKANKSASESS